MVNGKILKQNLFKKIWVQPASGDAGGSLGAALSKYYYEDNNERVVNKNDNMQGAFLGEDYKKDEVRQTLQKIAVFKEVDSQSLIKTTANLISKGNAIGWFQGRMELTKVTGARSIIADLDLKICKKT